MSDPMRVRPHRGESPRSLRVTVLSHTATLGGAELALVRLLGALPANDCDVNVILLESGPLQDALVTAGVEVRVVPLRAETLALSRRDLLRSPAKTLRAVADIAAAWIHIQRCVRDSAPDIVQTNSMKAHVIGVALKVVTRTPLVWYLHDRLAPDYLPRIVAAVLRALSLVPDHVIVNSAATAATVPRRTTVAYPGFAAEQALSPTQVMTRRAEEATFLLLGRISPTKGQMEFVQAAAQVLQREPRARFLIAGAPVFGSVDYCDAVHERVRHEGLEDAFEFLGFTAQPEGLFDRVTALVHASPVPEPFGQVVLEACVRGVPVIATRAGGVPEILSNDEGATLGILVPPGDPTALASAMLEVLTDPRASRARALRAHEFALGRFPVTATATEVRAVWTGLRQRPLRREGPLG